MNLFKTIHRLTLGPEKKKKGKTTYKIKKKKRKMGSKSSVDNLQDEKPCSLQRRLFTPIENRKNMCAALCELSDSSKRTRCKNRAKVWMPTAPLVLELEGCCMLCNQHKDVALEKFDQWKFYGRAVLANLALGQFVSSEELCIMANSLNSPSEHFDVNNKKLIYEVMPDKTAANTNCVSVISSMVGNGKPSSTSRQRRSKNKRVVNKSKGYRRTST